MNWLLKNSYAAFLGLLIFIVGFIIGTILDIIFLNIYRKWDPKEDNNSKLIILFVIQLYIIIFMIHISYSKKERGSVFTFGLISSQIFLLEHTIESLSNIMYKRLKFGNKEYGKQYERLRPSCSP